MLKYNHIINDIIDIIIIIDSNKFSVKKVRSPKMMINIKLTIFTVGRVVVYQTRSDLYLSSFFAMIERSSSRDLGKDVFCFILQD